MVMVRILTCFHQIVSIGDCLMQSEMGPIEAGSMESSKHEVIFGGTRMIVVSIKGLQNPTLLMHKQRPIKS